MTRVQQTKPPKLTEEQQNAKLADVSLEHIMKNRVCDDLDDAKKEILFGMRCIKETPIPRYTHPANRLAGQPLLLDAIGWIDSWLEGTAELPTHQLLEVRRAAGMPADSGEHAAFYSVVSLFDAAAEAVGGQSHQVRRVLGHINLVAHLARRSADEGLTLPAVVFQGRLFEEMFSER